MSKTISSVNIALILATIIRQSLSQFEPYSEDIVVDESVGDVVVEHQTQTGANLRRHAIADRVWTVVEPQSRTVCLAADLQTVSQLIGDSLFADEKEHRFEVEIHS